MRILHLVGRSHRRGAEQVALELAAELESRGHRNLLLAVTLGHEGEHVAELEPLVAVPSQGPRELVHAARQLRRRLRALRRDPSRGAPDVILAHGAAAALVAVAASPRRGPSIVWQTIVAMAPQSFRGVQGAGWRVAVRRLDGVVALTTELGDEARRLGYRGPVWPIPNARQSSRYEHLDRAVEAARLRTELGVGAETALLGLVGFLVAQKQPEQAVDVLAELRRAGQDVHLVVAGSGPLSGEVERRADEHGVRGHVSLVGHRDDVPQVLAGLDLLILTSADEGIPGVIIEAAMAGCPVITYPFGGVRELIDPGTNGVILAEPSVTLMAKEAAALLDDPAGRRAMADAAKRDAGRFSMATVSLVYESHLRSLPMLRR
jgi:glycosyltransferase involved in cell wall biosynthesis